jgi:hypothetical protein
MLTSGLVTGDKNEYMQIFTSIPASISSHISPSLSSDAVRHEVRNSMNTFFNVNHT